MSKNKNKVHFDDESSFELNSDPDENSDSDPDENSDSDPDENSNKFKTYFPMTQEEKEMIHNFDDMNRLELIEFEKELKDNNLDIFYQYMIFKYNLYINKIPSVIYNLYLNILDKSKDTGKSKSKNDDIYYDDIAHYIILTMEKYLKYFPEFIYFIKKWQRNNNIEEQEKINDLLRDYESDFPTDFCNDLILTLKGDIVKDFDTNFFDLMLFKDYISKIWNDLSRKNYKNSNIDEFYEYMEHMLEYYSKKYPKLKDIIVLKDNMTKNEKIFMTKKVEKYISTI